MQATDPSVTFLLVLAIGVIAGFLSTGLLDRRGLLANSPDRPEASSRAH